MQAFSASHGFPSLVPCLPPPRARCPMLHAALRRRGAVSPNAQHVAICDLFCSGRATRPSKAAFPFCRAVWDHHKHWRYQTWQGRTRKCSCAGWPRSSAQKSELSVCNVPLLKYEGEQNNALFCLIVCYSAGGHTSNHLKMRLSNSAPSPDWRV